MSRSRKWCLTINNPTQSQREDLIASLSDSVRYMILAKEVGAEGTPHLQGFVYWSQPKSLRQMKTLFPRAHLEVARGTPAQAAEYCKKDNDFVEVGECPLTSKEKGNCEKERWEDARTAAKEGRLDDIPADIYVRHYRTLKLIAKDHLTIVENAPDVTGIWIWGKPGVGKSYHAREKFENAYFKMANKWWDGYQMQPNVILDDLDTQHRCLGHHLKIWSDRYGFLAETKGGVMFIRPEKIVITSNYKIEEIFEDMSLVEALKRRFKVIHMLTRQLT